MLMTDLQLIEAENAAILRRRDGLPRLKARVLKKRPRQRGPAEVGGNTAASDNTTSVSASEHKLSEVLAKVRNGHRVIPSAATRVLIEERLTPRRDDLAAAHALVAERLQPRPGISPTTVRLVEQIRNREVGRTAPATDDDLRERMRKALVRP